MNAREGPDPEREMAEGLARALERAFASDAPVLSLKAARDVAQILGLDALDRALVTFEPHAGRGLPTELVPLRDRLLRMAARVRETGRDTPFREEAGELEALAGEIRSIEWTMVSAHDPRATLSALAALEDVRLSEPVARDLEHVRLTLPVASALRAALDWCDAGAGSGRSAIVRTEGAVLEVRLPAVEPSGLDAAGHVLGGVGGALIPASGGAWVARVPCVAARATWLVVVQGGRTLALPWHSVSRVHMMPAAQIEGRSAELGIPLAAPLEAVERTARELPVVTVALGLKRAWLVADRLIWRLAGDSGADPASEAPGMVRTDDGTECELVDVAQLLGPLPGPRVPVSVEISTALEPAAVEPLPPPEAAARVAPADSPAPRRAVVRAMAPRAAAARPVLLSPEHVRAVEGAPRALGATEVMPLPAPAPAPAAPAPAVHHEPSPAPAPREPMRALGSEEMLRGFAAAFDRPRAEAPAAPARPAPRALVAEDSLVARVFLARLLEAEGFEVHSVDRASAMWDLLATGPWSLLCVDIELPDARGEALLAEAARRLAPFGDAELVALVRDEEDEDAASRAGVGQVFRKPFDQDAVARLAARRRAPGNTA